MRCDAVHDPGAEAPAPHRPRFDRGPRPLLRGILHERSTWAFIGSSIPLIAVTAHLHGAATVTWMTALYTLCLIGSMGVSALYHLGPWRSESSVLMWRRADHAMIAVFIAGTYGPVAVTALPPGRSTLLLGLCWAGALFAVLLNVVWVHHPRWLGVSVYLILGWLVIWEIPDLWAGVGPAVTLLLGAGGLVYTLGALVYALKWPNPSLRVFGFHEVFHAATIIAAVLHQVAIWLTVTSTGV
ncbi:PAQR family membrane homeostasis protein TrhA [Corynebacterium sp. UBA2622]|uniref:PAQR family membrane homeostasis protein TrhA n=1 Tax=Corynebacterium sp. UBA2622 TaxID=1946393 RepID=UPI0025C4DDBD|nr:hemolysin III family protein [Corynebacterium sp. UBA2622]